MTDETPMRVMMVTRERSVDRRYGLGRSLAPLMDELRRAGHQVFYVTQGDWSERDELRLRRTHHWVMKLARHLPGETDQLAALL
jgi:hypothetical protein